MLKNLWCGTSRFDSISFFRWQKSSPPRGRLPTRRRAWFAFRLFPPLQCLTSVFGMGTGVATAVSSPDSFRAFPENRITVWKTKVSLLRYGVFDFFSDFVLVWINLRSISISQLNASQHLHPWPIYLVVFEGSYLLFGAGSLILEPVSRLDAFSVYPIHSQLSGCAAGATTGAP